MSIFGCLFGHRDVVKKSVNGTAKWGTTDATRDEMVKVAQVVWKCRACGKQGAYLTDGARIHKWDLEFVKSQTREFDEFLGIVECGCCLPDGTPCKPTDEAIVLRGKLEKLENENEYYKGVTEDLLEKIGEEKDVKGNVS